MISIKRNEKGCAFADVKKQWCQQHLRGFKLCFSFCFSERNLCLPELPSASHQKGDIWDAGEGTAETRVQRVRFSRWGTKLHRVAIHTHTHIHSALWQHLCVMSSELKTGNISQCLKFAEKQLTRDELHRVETLLRAWNSLARVRSQIHIHKHKHTEHTHTDIHVHFQFVHPIWAGWSYRSKMSFHGC